MKIALVTDSSADILKSEEETYGVRVVRDPISVDQKEYLEEITISLNEIIQALNKGQDVKTSMPRTGDIIETFNQLFDEGYDHILYIPIMEALAGAYSNGLNVANLDEFSGKVTVINAKSVSAPLYFILKDIQTLINEGQSPDQIKEIVETQATIDAILLPAKLSFLAKGGRISPAIAAIGNMVKLIPLLAVTQSGIEKQDTKRTLKKAVIQAVETIVARNQPASDYHWAIVYGTVDTEIKNMMHQTLQELLGEDITIELRQLGSVIMCHTGPESIAVASSKKLI